MIDWLHNNLIWTEGAQILLVTIAAGVGALLFYRPLLIPVFGFLLFTVYFFRNPDRVCLPAVDDPKIIICPADGKIVDIQYDPKGGIEGFYSKVSIFLSPIDVHVNWSPIAGTIDQVQYRQGTFAMAFLPKSSELNERNDIHIKAENGKTILVRQIAGTVARRICCWVKPQDSVKAGTKIGMIRFGSRVDIFLPANVALSVGLGQRVYGGQTVLGRWTA
ncbi:MAG TPA: phosphatidylserine decarboxylase family protein [Candidatus Babeliales bacterium]|nr:phosphatidylserine decarboxylase family protein [Candidatus Babeliales bacterium]